MSVENNIIFDLKRLVESNKNYLVGYTQGGSVGTKTTINLSSSYKGKAYLENVVLGSGCSLPTKVICFQMEDGTWLAVGEVKQELVSTRVDKTRRFREVAKQKHYFIKVLFSVIENEIQQFYVGGDRIIPFKIFELPSNYFIRRISFNNIGNKKDDWIFTIQFGIKDPRLTFTTIPLTLVFIEGKFPTESKNTIFYEGTILDPKGYGYWVSRPLACVGNTLGFEGIQKNEIPRLLFISDGIRDFERHRTSSGKPLILLVNNVFTQGVRPIYDNSTIITQLNNENWEINLFTYSVNKGVITSYPAKIDLKISELNNINQFANNLKNPICGLNTINSFINLSGQIYSYEIGQVWWKSQASTGDLKFSIPLLVNKTLSKAFVFQVNKTGTLLPIISPPRNDSHYKVYLFSESDGLIPFKFTPNLNDTVTYNFWRDSLNYIYYDFTFLEDNLYRIKQNKSLPLQYIFDPIQSLTTKNLEIDVIKYTLQHSTTKNGQPEVDVVPVKEFKVKALSLKSSNATIHAASYHP